MTSGLRNPKYYKGAFLEIWKLMKVKEEGMEVQEETVILIILVEYIRSFIMKLWLDH